MLNCNVNDIGAAALICEYHIKGLLKTGVVIFTGGTKINIFATTLADNPIEITRSDYSAYLYVPNNQKTLLCRE